ncbi:MAG: four helix bundle suffix domain-containing protein [Lentisphaeria bacterium]|nr:four helix bundle suffix domain-containing protein [Lentisphaeria bacterium]
MNGEGNGNKRKKTDAANILRPSDGYKNLKVYKLATLIHDVTVRFVELYIPAKSRTCDQMVQAARSGKQNIVEGSIDGATSAKLEINLYNVARGSLEELKIDYLDYLRQHGMMAWTMEHPLAVRFNQMRVCSNRQFKSFVEWAEKQTFSVDCRSVPLKSVIVANAAILLINVASDWLKSLMVKKLEDFESNGGFSERMYHARLNCKNNGAE